MTKAHVHRWGDWNYCGGKRKVQVRGCLDCPITQTRRGTNLDADKVAECLSGAWQRYVVLFGEPPHGTELQMAALLQLAQMDEWGSVENRVKVVDDSQEKEAHREECTKGGCS